jgi:LCP family protein required for cell wall assembly
MAEPATPKRRRRRRTWPQRFTLLVVCVVAFACLAAAGALAGGQWVLSQRQLAPLARTTSQVSGASDPEVVVPDLSTTSSNDDEPGSTTIPTLPASPTGTAPMVLAEPDAANFLVVGADNGDCGDDPLIEDRSDLGERSDTIMVWRANPATNQLAVLSFPRDLYVEFPSGSKARINSAFRRDDPSRLQEVINFNFGIQVDHYIQIDFCAFRRLVNAVGGVEVPFEFPARDRPRANNPPLFLIEQTGCVNFENPPGSGNWESDPTSDFGRITRQQDFLRRVLSKVIDDGLYDPDVASALITTNREYLVTDPDLTVRKMLEFGNALKNFDPGSVSTYRIESSPHTTSNGDMVEIPQIKGDNMNAILAVFRGEATLADAPDQAFDVTEDDRRSAPTTTVAAATDESSDESGDATSEPATATTLPEVEAEENVVGVAPDRSVTCP